MFAVEQKLASACVRPSDPQASSPGRDDVDALDWRKNELPSSLFPLPSSLSSLHVKQVKAFERQQLIVLGTCKGESIAPGSLTSTL